MVLTFYTSADKCLKQVKLREVLRTNYCVWRDCRQKIGRGWEFLFFFKYFFVSFVLLYPCFDSKWENEKTNLSNVKKKNN